MAPTTTYADKDDVQALLPLRSNGGITIGDASSPTTGQVEDFLDQIAAEIDSVLVNMGYTVPVDGTNDVNLIKRYLSQKVAAMTFHAAYGMLSEPPARVKRWEDEYDAWIKRLIDREQRLVDSAPSARVGVIKVGRYRED